MVRDRRGQVDQLLADANQAGLLGGVPLGTWYPELADCFLVTVTEKRTKDEIDALTSCLTETTSNVETIHA